MSATGPLSELSHPSGEWVPQDALRVLESWDRPGGDGLERPRRDGVDPDPARTELACEIPHDCLERRFRRTHPVIHRPCNACVEGERDDRSTGYRHQRRERRRQRLQRVAAHVKCGADRAPRSFEKAATEAIGGRKADGMNEPVDAAPETPHVLGNRLHLGHIGDVHLEDLGRRLEPLRALAGETHRPPERGEHHLCAGGLGGGGDGKGDAFGGQNTGDHDSFAAEQTMCRGCWILGTHRRRTL